MLRLTQHRMKLGKSQAWLARQARIDQSTLSRVERGLVRPYPKQIARIARALGVQGQDVDRLLDAHEVQTNGTNQPGHTAGRGVVMKS